MNSMQLKDKLKNISKGSNIDFNVLLRFYMYDRFIERLSESKYRDNFILKGGFYLSTLFGIKSRSTMDIDTAIKGISFNEQNIKDVINEILSIDIEDGTILTLRNITTIRDEDEYGGFRLFIDCKLENIRESFQIDVATGDPITPKQIEYKYMPTLGKNYIKLWSYNIETLLAEKLETILSRAETSSRIRDYYDVFLICNRYKDSINKKHFQKAVENTFKKREFNSDINETFEIIKSSIILRKRWESYSKKYEYARNIKYEDVIKSIEEIIQMLDLINV